MMKIDLTNATPLGHGGQGEVVKARLSDGKDVAVKTFRKRDGVRMACEATALIECGAIPELPDLYYVDVRRRMLVMELIEGHCLYNSTEGAQHADFFISLAEAIEALHVCGWVHRDIKPHNIMVRDGAPVIIDLGYAFPFHMKEDAIGRKVGSPSYLAPELIEATDGATIDHRADIYSFGATLHKVVAGRSLFQEPHETEVGMMRLVRRQVADETFLSDLCPEWAVDTVVACTQRHPSDRPSSMREVVRMLMKSSS